MAESRDHRRLVATLVRTMIERGITVQHAETAGWPRPELVGGRRPDVLGYYATGSSVVAAEAKRGPELWSCRRQLQEIAAALPDHGPVGAGALLIIAVLPGWEADAVAVCSSLDSPRTTRAVWSPYGRELPSGMHDPARLVA